MNFNSPKTRQGYQSHKPTSTLLHLHDTFKKLEVPQRMRSRSNFELAASRLIDEPNFCVASFWATKLSDKKCIKIFSSTISKRCHEYNLLGTSTYVSKEFVSLREAAWVVLNCSPVKIAPMNSNLKSMQNIHAECNVWRQLENLDDLEISNPENRQ